MEGTVEFTEKEVREANIEWKNTIQDEENGERIGYS